MKKSHVAKFAFLFSVGWFLAHGERVDMLGYMIFLFLIIYHKYEVKITIKNFLLLMSGGLALFFLLIVVGFMRTGGEITFSSLVTTLIVQPTACDIAYVFNSSIHFAKTESLYMGFTYLANLWGVIPLVETPKRPELLLQKFYHAPGGEFYFSEALMNYGYVFGILISLTMFAAIVIFLLKYQNKNIYIRLTALFLISALPRLIWYGKHYAISGLTLFIPMMMILRIISRKFMDEVEVLYDE
jgi:hypothetical protein